MAIFTQAKITHRVIFLLFLKLSAFSWISSLSFSLLQYILGADSSHLLWQKLLKLSN